MATPAEIAASNAWYQANIGNLQGTTRIGPQGQTYDVSQPAGMGRFLQVQRDQYMGYSAAEQADAAAEQAKRAAAFSVPRDDTALSPAAQDIVNQYNARHYGVLSSGGYFYEQPKTIYDQPNPYRPGTAAAITWDVAKTGGGTDTRLNLIATTPKYTPSGQIDWTTTADPRYVMYAARDIGSVNVGFDASKLTGSGRQMLANALEDQLPRMNISGAQLMAEPSRWLLESGTRTAPVRTAAESTMQAPSYLSTQQVSAGRAGQFELQDIGGLVYAPYGDQRQTEIKNAKLAIAPETGEVAIYQYDQKYDRWGLIGGGGRNALQSGMFSINRPLTPWVVTQESGGVNYAPSANVSKARAIEMRPDMFSRMGAEAYGGHVQMLDARTLSGEAISRFGSMDNLANYANQVAGGKAEAPGAAIPWGIAKGSPFIQLMGPSGLTGTEVKGAFTPAGQWMYGKTPEQAGSKVNVVPLSGVPGVSVFGLAPAVGSGITPGAPQRVPSDLEIGMKGLTAGLPGFIKEPVMGFTRAISPGTIVTPWVGAPELVKAGVSKEELPKAGGADFTGKFMTAEGPSDKITRTVVVQTPGGYEVQKQTTEMKFDITRTPTLFTTAVQEPGVLETLGKGAGRLVSPITTPLNSAIVSAFPGVKQVGEAKESDIALGIMVSARATPYLPSSAVFNIPGPTGEFTRGFAASQVKMFGLHPTETLGIAALTFGEGALAGALFKGADVAAFGLESRLLARGGLGAGTWAGRAYTTAGVGVSAARTAAPYALGTMYGVSVAGRVYGGSPEQMGMKFGEIFTQELVPGLLGFGLGDRLVGDFAKARFGYQTPFSFRQQWDRFNTEVGTPSPAGGGGYGGPTGGGTFGGGGGPRRGGPAGAGGSPFDIAFAAGKMSPREYALRRKLAEGELTQQQFDNIMAGRRPGAGMTPTPEPIITPPSPTSAAGKSPLADIWKLPVEAPAGRRTISLDIVEPKSVSTSWRSPFVTNEGVGYMFEGGRVPGTKRPFMEETVVFPQAQRRLPAGEAPLAIGAGRRPVGLLAEFNVGSALKDWTGRLDEATAHPERVVTTIALSRGFTAKPSLVSGVEFDAIRSEYPILARGIRNAKYAYDLTQGKYFLGEESMYGTGIYTAYDIKARHPSRFLGVETAREYGEHIVALKLKPGSRVIEKDALFEERDAYLRKNKNVTDQEYDILSGDASIFAAMKGYDAIKLKDMGYMLILNRGAMAAFKLPELVTTGGKKVAPLKSEAIPLGPAVAGVPFETVFGRQPLRLAAPETRPLLGAAEPYRRESIFATATGRFPKGFDRKKFTLVGEPYTPRPKVIYAGGVAPVYRLPAPGETAGIFETPMDYESNINWKKFMEQSPQERAMTFQDQVGKVPTDKTMKEWWNFKKETGTEMSFMEYRVMQAVSASRGYKGEFGGYISATGRTEGTWLGFEIGTEPAPGHRASIRLGGAYRMAELMANNIYNPYTDVAFPTAAEFHTHPYWRNKYTGAITSPATAIFPSGADLTSTGYRWWAETHQGATLKLEGFFIGGSIVGRETAPGIFEPRSALMKYGYSERFGRPIPGKPTEVYEYDSVMRGVKRKITIARKPYQSGTHLENAIGSMNAWLEISREYGMGYGGTGKAGAAFVPYDLYNRAPVPAKTTVVPPGEIVPFAVAGERVGTLHLPESAPQYWYKPEEFAMGRTFVEKGFLGEPEPMGRAEFGPKSPVVWQDGIAWNTARSDFPVVQNDINTMEFGRVPRSEMQTETFLTWMTPKEMELRQIEMFSATAKRLPPGEMTGREMYYFREQFNPNYSIAEINAGMDRGDVFNPLTLFYRRTGEIDYNMQEGAHRTLALNKRGVEKIPVWITIEKEGGEFSREYKLTPAGEEVAGKYPRFEIGEKPMSQMVPGKMQMLGKPTPVPTRGKLTMMEAASYIKERYFSGRTLKTKGRYPSVVGDMAAMSDYIGTEEIPGRMHMAPKEIIPGEKLPPGPKGYGYEDFAAGMRGGGGPLLETTKALVPRSTYIMRRALTEKFEVSFTPTDMTLAYEGPAGGKEMRKFDRSLMGAYGHEEAWTLAPSGRRTVDIERDVTINMASGQVTLIGAKTTRETVGGKALYQREFGSFNLFEPTLSIAGEKVMPEMPPLGAYEAMRLEKGERMVEAERTQKQFGVVKARGNEFAISEAENRLIPLTEVRDTREINKAFDAMETIGLSVRPRAFEKPSEAAVKAGRTRKVEKFMAPEGTPVTVIPEGKMREPIRGPRPGQGPQYFVESVENTSPAAKEMWARMTSELGFKERPPTAKREQKSTATAMAEAKHFREGTIIRNKFMFAEARGRMEKPGLALPTEPLIDTTEAMRVSAAMFTIEHTKKQRRRAGVAVFIMPPEETLSDLGYMGRIRGLEREHRRSLEERRRMESLLPMEREMLMRPRRAVGKVAKYPRRGFITMPKTGEVSERKRRMGTVIKADTKMATALGLGRLPMGKMDTLYGFRSDVITGTRQRQYVDTRSITDTITDTRTRERTKTTTDIITREIPPFTPILPGGGFLPMGGGGSTGGGGYRPGYRSQREIIPLRSELWGMAPPVRAAARVIKRPQKIVYVMKKKK